MKTLVLILNIILFSSHCAQCQDDAPFNRYYTLTAKTILNKCDEQANTATFGNSTEELPRGAKFTIVRKIEVIEINTAGVNEVKTYYIAQFWKWDEGSVNNDKFVELNNQKIYFRFTTDELSTYTTQIIKKWEPVAGTMTVPFKFRMQGGFSFSKDISITGLGGIKRNFGNSGKLSLALVFGVGLSSVTLDSLNTGGTVQDAEERAAATLSSGLLFQWERLQVGLMVGGDLLPASSRDNWAYHGKPWLAVGIGFSIFKSDAEEVKSEAKNKE